MEAVVLSSHRNTAVRPDARTRVDVLTAGANRGARLMQSAYEAFNRASGRFALAPIYADPIPERALARAREGQGRGLAARAIEASIEEVLPASALRHAPLIISVDDPQAIADTLHAVDLSERSVLIYFLIQLPSEELVGLRAVLQEDDDAERRGAAEFFERLSDVTARSGSAAILGPQGRAEHIALEPAYRAWFAAHMQANMAKIVARTRAESDPLEVTINGRSTMPLHVHTAARGWMDPAQLARNVVERPTSPIHRGRDFMIGEVGTEGIRFHVVRLRATDGKAAIRAAAVVDPDAYRAADVQRRERLRREALDALRHAEQQTVSRTRPAYTTD